MSKRVNSNSMKIGSMNIFWSSNVGFCEVNFKSDNVMKYVKDSFEFKELNSLILINSVLVYRNVVYIYGIFIDLDDLLESIKVFSRKRGVIRKVLKVEEVGCFVKKFKLNKGVKRYNIIKGTNFLVKKKFFFSRVFSDRSSFFLS